MNKALHACVAALFAASFSIANAAPETGWYWNPAESGRGFFVESNNGVTFIGAYLYDADGHARWLVSGSPNADPYNYTGELYSMRNGQTLFGGYVAPQGPDKVGTLSVHFSDDTHGVVTWPGGTVNIERQIFGGTNAPFQPASGWWWNPKESGSGYSIEVQGDKLFLVGFMYDGEGRPVWYFSAGPVNSVASYSGSLLQFANGQTMDGPYNPPSTPATIGKVDIDFVSTNFGVLTFSPPGSSVADTTHPRAASPSRATTIVPQFYKDLSTGKRYLVTFVVREKQPNTFPGITGATLDYTWSGKLSLIEYEDEECRSSKDHRCFLVEKGDAFLVLTVDVVLGVGTCHGQAVKPFKPKPGDLNLKVAHPVAVPRTWSLSLSLNAGDVDVSSTCTVYGHTYTQTMKEGAETKREFFGHVSNKLVNPSTYDPDYEPDLVDSDGSFYAEYSDGASTYYYWVNISPN